MLNWIAAKIGGSATNATVAAPAISVKSGEQATERARRASSSGSGQQQQLSSPKPSTVTQSPAPISALANAIPDDVYQREYAALSTTEALLKVLETSGWASVGSVVETLDLEFLPNSTPHVVTTRTYDVEGEMPRNASIASSAKTPAHVRELVQAIGARRREEDIGFLADYETLKDYDLGALEVFGGESPHESKRISLASLCGDRGLILLCWTSWNDEEATIALETLDEFMKTCGWQSGLKACAALLDASNAKAPSSSSPSKRQASSGSDKSAPRDFASQYPAITFVSAGPGGWDSQLARELALEDVHPTAFFFTTKGRLVDSGFLEEVLETSMVDENDLDENDESLGEAEDGEDACDCCGHDHHHHHHAHAHGYAHSSSEKERAFLARLASDRQTQQTFLARLPRFLSALLRGETVTTGTEGPSGATSSRRLTLAGDVYPEDEPALETFLTYLREECGLTKVGIRGVRKVTRALPLAPGMRCDECSAAIGGRMRYACMVCSQVVPPGGGREKDWTLCDTCSAKHDSCHPLAVIDISFVTEGGGGKKDFFADSAATKTPTTGAASSNILYGRNHVRLRSEETSADDAGMGEDGDEASQHPFVVCDACGGRPTLRRYKNLCLPDYDLCEACYGMLRQYSSQVGGEFEKQFHCRRGDVFCLLRSSRGVEFSRVVMMSGAKRGEKTSPATSVETNHPTSTTGKVPVGHTAFTWFAPSGVKVPLGHTPFTWGEQRA